MFCFYFFIFGAFGRWFLYPFEFCGMGLCPDWTVDGCIVQGYRVFAFEGKAFWIRIGMGWGWDFPEDLVK